VGAAGALAAFGLAACGSSSHKTTTTSTSSTHAVAAHGTPVPGVPSPSGAIAAKSAGLAKLKVVSKGVSAHIKGLDNVPIAQAIPTVSGDLNHFWSGEFANSGVQWPTANDVLVQSSPVQTPCSSKPTIAPTDPMFVCASQTTANFYWPVQWMQQNVDTDPGGVTLSLSMSGQYSFVVQDLFGFFKQLQSGQMSLAQWEQQNVCLTGLYARSVNDRGLFEQADVSAFKSWLSTISGGSASGAATNQQLSQAFGAGYNGGSPSACGVGGSGTPTTTTTTP
jgi:predicted metalloprotease